MSSRAGPAALAAAAVLAISIVVLPWYSLDDYTASGWDGTFWARATVILVLLSVLARRLGLIDSRAFAAVAAVCLAMIAFRVAFPPDFGFDFDGLEVPVERRVGAWVGLAAAAALAAMAVALARGASAASAGSARSAASR